VLQKSSLETCNTVQKVGFHNKGGLERIMSTNIRNTRVVLLSLLLILTTVSLPTLTAQKSYAKSYSDEASNIGKHGLIVLYPVSIDQVASHHHSGGKKHFTFPDVPPVNIESSHGKGSDVLFNETSDSPASKHLVIGSTTKHIDSSGTLHIIGEITNNGSTDANVGSMSATIYGTNKQVLAIEYGAPQPTTISPGQSSTFEILTGGGLDAVSDPSDITAVKYHLGF
jgi:hypothetical protein